MVLPCFAQVPTAEVTGRITDASGSVVAGAMVEIVSISNGVKWEVKTNAEGYYTQPLLPPDDYRMTVRLAGFKQETRTVTLTVEQVARLDFTLQVGAVSETVEVVGTAPLLESSTASIGQVVETELISEMPLNGRNYLDLAKLSMGVTEPVGSDQSGTAGDRAKNGGSFSANGVRPDMNNFILNGMDNNAKLPDLSNNSNVVMQPSVDALQEFRVETNSYSAQYGYSAGAVVNATLKSGSNSIHGTAFEFIRNSAVDARNFFLLPTDKTPPLARNQYGGTVGGPVRKNKTFYFASWEGAHWLQGVTYVESLPSAPLRTGDFTGVTGTLNDPAAAIPNAAGTGYTKVPFPGRIIPTSRIAYTSSKLMAATPLPEVPGSEVNNYVASPTQHYQRNAFDTRGDHNFSEADRLSLFYSYYMLHNENPGPLPAPIIGSANFQESINDQSGHVVTLGETHVFGPTLVNEFRGGYNRISNRLLPFVNSYIDPDFGIGYIPPQPNMNGLPSITFNDGYSDLGEAGFLPDAKGSDTATVSDNLMWTKGSHFLKFGGQYRWVRSRFDIYADARGVFAFTSQFTGNAFGDFLLGDPNSATLDTVMYGDLRSHYYGAYVDDEWKATPKLTVDLGLRWEVWQPPYERHNQQANFILPEEKFIFPNNKIPVGISPSWAMPIPSGVDARSLIETHYRNFAPRLGLARTLGANTVVRAGIGVFYGEPSALGASGRPTANPPFRLEYSPPANDGVHPNMTFATGFPLNALDPSNFNPQSLTLIAFNPYMKVPVIYHWSFTLQQQIGKYMLETGYVATKGSRLSTNYNINTAQAGSGSAASRQTYAPFNTINWEDSMGNSTYNAMQIRLQRRFSNGFSMLASYTYSKGVDLTAGGLVGDLAIRDVNNVYLEKGMSSSSVPHRFVVGYTYGFPVGRGMHFVPQNRFVSGAFGNWQVNGTTTIRDGHPFTVTWGSSSANAGAARPNRICNGTLPSDQRTVQDWYDKSCFVAGVAYNYPNSGRDVILGPGGINFDMSASKNFLLPSLREGTRLQLRLESFNLFNHPQFGQPNVNAYNAQGGTINFLANTPRQLQLGLKVIF
jgi:hypothetical protein